MKRVYDWNTFFFGKQMEAEREDKKQREALRDEERKRQEARRRKEEERLVCTFCRVDISVSVSEQLHAYGSPNPTLTCY